MNVYEFILILSSIIVGLGIAELFRGVSRALRGELKAGPLHSIWIALVFLLQVQWIWASWELHDRGTWFFPELIIFIVGPIGFYMAGTILFPAGTSKDSLDTHLMDRRRPFFIVLVIAVASLSISGWFVVNDPVRDQDIARFTAIVCFALLAMTKHKGVHWVTALGFLAAHLWFIYSFTLGIGQD